MKKVAFVAMLAGLTAFAAGSVAASADDKKARCRSVMGTVQLIPDTGCSVQKFFPSLDDGGPAFLGTMVSDIQNPTCFELSIGGDLQGGGFSGLTSDNVNAPELGAGQEPFSASSVLLLKSSDEPLLTSDVGLFWPDGSSIERLDIIEGGTGTLVVSGNLLTASGGQYKGTVCLPKK